jgi:hypothetical protein
MSDEEIEKEISLKKLLAQELSENLRQLRRGLSRRDLLVADAIVANRAATAVHCSELDLKLYISVHCSKS